MSINNVYTSKNKSAVKAIYSITPFTLLDYPDKTACILWFAGCNMRCAYCYNPDIVFGKGKINFDDALSFIKKRINLLDAIVLSGGECTLHNGLIDFIKKIKELGFLVKIDTNGSNPLIIKRVVNEKLIDFISLDFKAPAQKFQTITKSRLFKEFNETLNFLVASGFPFEVRTTLHSDLLKMDDIQNMLNHMENAKYIGKYFLQNYLDAPETIGMMGPSLKSYLPLNKLNSPYELVIRN